MSCSSLNTTFIYALAPNSNIHGSIKNNPLHPGISIKQFSDLKSVQYFLRNVVGGAIHVNGDAIIGKSWAGMDLQWKKLTSPQF